MYFGKDYIERGGKGAMRTSLVAKSATRIPIFQKMNLRLKEMILNV